MHSKRRRPTARHERKHKITETLIGKKESLGVLVQNLCAVQRGRDFCASPPPKGLYGVGLLNPGLDEPPLQKEPRHN